MTKAEFEKRLLITYLDEAEAYRLQESFFNAIVSMSLNKDCYIQEIEKSWASLRKNFGVSDGVCLHFTDIKALLNPHYFTRPLNKRNVAMEEIFCEKEQVLTDKIYDFYCSIIEILRNSNFIIQATGQRYLRNQMFSDKKIREYLQGSWYSIFKDHLDRMAYYLIKLSYDTYHAAVREKKNAKFHFYITKLRCDGDYAFTARNELRDAFSHCISNGTKRFNDEAIKKCFDEVRFIDKTEIGFCVSCEPNCNSRQISHAGNEIIDFITVYVGRYIAKDDLIGDRIAILGESHDEALEYYENSMTIQISGYPDIRPIDVLLDKFFSEN